MSDKELQKAGTQAIAKREAFIEAGDVTGTENIGGDEIRLPRLAIAQGMSPQMIEGDSSYIPGLKLFDMFNDLTGEIYGKGPLTFVPLRKDTRWIQFASREDGGGVIDLNVQPILPDGRMNPLCEWSQDENGEKVPPAATRYFEFVVILMKDAGEIEPIMLSIKDTNKWNRKAANQLMSFIKLARKPIYAGVYSVSSKSEKNDEGTFGVPVIGKLGLLDNPNVDDDTFEANKQTYLYCKGFAASLEGKVIQVQREAPSSDDTETYDGDVPGEDAPAQM